MMQDNCICSSTIILNTINTVQIIVNIPWTRRYHCLFTDMAHFKSLYGDKWIRMYSKISSGRSDIWSEELSLDFWDSSSESLCDRSIIKPNTLPLLFETFCLINSFVFQVEIVVYKFGFLKFQRNYMYFDPD